MSGRLMSAHHAPPLSDESLDTPHAGLIRGVSGNTVIVSRLESAITLWFTSRFNRCARQRITIPARPPPTHAESFKERPTDVAAPQNYLAVIKVVGIGGGGVNAIDRK